MSITNVITTSNMTKEEILDNYLKDKCCSREFDYIDDYVVYGLIENAMQEYADQQTKELQERVEHLQAKIDELEKANDNYKQALHGIYNLCDSDNSTHEHIWHIANAVLH